MDDFIVDNLVLIITKQCNLKCKHCLRGESENSYMQDETIKSIFSKINKIGKLTISGGEPLLSEKTLNIITSIIEQTKKNNVSINNIQIVTNGTIYNEKITCILKELYSLSNYRDYNSLIISDDIYHHDELDRLNLSKQVELNINSFKKLAKELEINFYFHHLYGIINSGRARNLHVEKSEIDITRIEDMIRIGIMDNKIPELTINDDGMMDFFCNSYSDFSKRKLFDINEVDNVFYEVKRYLDDSPCGELFERFKLTLR